MRWCIKKNTSVKENNQKKKSDFLEINNSRFENN